MKKSKKKVLSILGGVQIAALRGVSVFAADPACSIDSSNPACKSGGNLFDTAGGIVGVVLAIVGVIATIVIIIGGIMIATSAGDPGKVKKGKNAILYAVIGLAVAVLAYAIVNFTVDSAAN